MITTSIVAAATQPEYWKAPRTTRNSPMKPDSPGSPMLAKVKSPKIAA